MLREGTVKSSLRTAWHTAGAPQGQARVPGLAPTPYTFLQTAQRCPGSQHRQCDQAAFLPKSEKGGSHGVRGSSPGRGSGCPAPTAHALMHPSGHTRAPAWATSGLHLELCHRPMTWGIPSCPCRPGKVQEHLTFRYAEREQLQPERRVCTGGRTPQAVAPKAQTSQDWTQPVVSPCVPSGPRWPPVAH